MATANVQEQADTSVGDSAPVKIGVLNPTSGPLAPFGLDVNSGIELFVHRAGATFGGRPVALFFGDTAGEPDRALAEAQRLVEEEKVDLLMGIVSSDVAAPMAQFADAQQIPLIVTIAGAADSTGPARSPFLFRTAMANGQQEGPLARYLVTETDARRAAVIAWDSSAGAERSAAFTAAFTEAGGTVVTEQMVPLETTDFAPYLDVLEQSDVDVVYTFLAGAQAVTFVRQMRQRADLATHPIVGTGYLTAGVLQQMGEDAPPMIQAAEYTAAIDNPMHSNFVAWLLDDASSPLPTDDDKARAASDVYVMEGYLGASVVAQALDATGGDTSDAPALLQALATGNFDSVSGPLHFDAQGQAIRNLYITELVAGEDGTIAPSLLTVIADVPWSEVAGIDSDMLFQTSTLSALQRGVYDGKLTVGQLTQHGDFGLGTFNALDGEMVVLDGQVYQVKDDGIARLPDEGVQTPFAAVTFFAPEQSATIDDSLACADLYAQLDTLLPSLDVPYAIKIDGTFASLQVRAPHRESQPYPPLAEALADQAIFERQDASGTMVGFHLPDAMAGMNAAGYHFHFISTDRQTGGHLLDCQTDALTVEFDALESVYIDFLPD